MNEITAADFAADIASRRRTLNKERATLAAKIADPEKYINEFDIATLAEVTAKQQVLGIMDENITRMLGEGQSDADVLALVKSHFERVALNAWKPNSTSNISVEIDLVKHYYAVQVYQVLRGEYMASI